MFTIVKKPTYAWNVDVNIPDPLKPGRWKTHTFIGHFKKLGDSEFRERLDALTDKDLHPAERYQRENDFLAEVLVNWEGIADEDGTPLPLTVETLDAVLEMTEVRAALFDAALNSRRKAAAKN